MTNDELDHLARCEDAMKQARWAIALQLRRWRDGDTVDADAELQAAYDALADIVGESKQEEKRNAWAQKTPHERISDLLGAAEAARLNKPTQTWGDEPTAYV